MRSCIAHINVVCVCVCLCTNTRINIHTKHTHAHTFTHARMQTHDMLWSTDAAPPVWNVTHASWCFRMTRRLCIHTYVQHCCCRGSSSNALKMGHTYAYATHSMLLIRMHITGRPVAEALPPMPSKWVADRLIRSDWVPSALRKKKTNWSFT